MGPKASRVKMLFDIVFGWGGLGGVLSAASFAAYFFLPEIPFLTTNIRKMLLYVGIAAAAATVAYSVVFSAGYKQHAAEVDRQDERAIERTELRVKNVDDCYDQKGIWDATRGRCTR